MALPDTIFPCASIQYVSCILNSVGGEWLRPVGRVKLQKEFRIGDVCELMTVCSERYDWKF